MIANDLVADLGGTIAEKGDESLVAVKDESRMKKTSVCLAEKVAVVGVVDFLEAEGNQAEAALEEPAPKEKKKSEKLDKNGRKPLKKPNVLSAKNVLNGPPLASEAKGPSGPNDLREACEEKEVNEVSVLNEAKEGNAVSAEKGAREASVLSEANELSVLKEVKEEKGLSELNELSEASEVNVAFKEKTSNEKIVMNEERDSRKEKKQSPKNETSELKAEVKELLPLWSLKWQLATLTCVVLSKT